MVLGVVRSSVIYNDRQIYFGIEYRNRKTMAIHISGPDKVLVLSPTGIPEDIIRERVKSKGRWILKKLSQLRDTSLENFRRDFKEGETFLFLGNNYNLEIVKNRRKIPKVFFREGKFYLETGIFDPVKMRKAMEKWYREKADRIINERVGLYIEKIGKRPQDVKVKEQKRRWGSCAAKSKLYFNWRIIMAPGGIIDYVVVHEMSHLVHANHSKKFWQKVESVLPDYKKRRKWLKDNGIKLDL